MKRNAKNSALLSDQVSQVEITVIVRELRKTLAAGISGDVVEFGCYVGTTSVFLGQELKSTGRGLWLYDSFAGLPDKTQQDVSPLGEQFRPGELLAPRRVLEANLKHAGVNGAHVKKAWFSELTERDIPREIAFAFLDGDYYRSILDPLTLIWPHLQPGATIVVDDYGNQALPGAAKAVDEWAQAHKLHVRSEASLAIFVKP